MKKQYRLKKNWEFDRVLKSKNQLINKYLIVYYVDSKSFKCGLTCPKKFINSVGRNFHKRQLRAILNDLNLTDLNHEFVFIIRKAFIDENDFWKKHKAIAQMLEKLKDAKQQQKK
ncbi:ribonuclease P protein component [Mycoplasma sp. Ms02]|uniref:ribonuclease P protein component n=1 Tax=Mycoplasma sp. Ms02 TaxID=353851 RepID=UPI001C891DEB|nr:ribonuclease P protein component [Mycoplasma sp. Ms02]QZE12110.1 ribonuclease P protein component [Mycoplasma sp. Ms02]